MAGKVLIAPNYETIEGKLIFLAGPIQGAPDWQAQAVSQISRIAPELNIASPRRAAYNDAGFVYAEQVDWERHYLRRAAENGVDMFWLAKESEHRCDRAYAQTTRHELAECKEWNLRDKTKVVIGIEAGFTGAKYIRHVYPKENPTIPIYDNLKETCDKAIELCL